MLFAHFKRILRLIVYDSEVRVACKMNSTSQLPPKPPGRMAPTLYQSLDALGLPVISAALLQLMGMRLFAGVE
jgi:hypothetical protein